jgi:polyhydroxybutyrate depolymerase
MLLVVLLVSLAGLAGLTGAADFGGRSKAYAEPVDQVQTAQLLRRLFGRKRDGDRKTDGGTNAAAGENLHIQKRTLDVGGRKRVYHLYIPQQVASTSAPLVLAFHGRGGNALGFAGRIGLQEMADGHGYVVVAPEGLDGNWNAGGDGEKTNADDLAFVKAIIDDVSGVTPINAARVYAMGLSKGGMMAYHAACELPGRFAAIAAVASTMSSKTCTAPSGVSLLHIHGTADENVPWEGGRGEQTGRRNDWPPVERGISIWSQGNQCPTMQAPRQVAQDTTCSSVRCGTGETVEVCKVQGGGHAWPGISPTKQQKKADTYVSQYFDATEHIAAFFDQNP